MKRGSSVKAEVTALRSTVWIGRNGVTPHLIDLIASQLRHRELLKVKVQRSGLVDKTVESIAEEVAEKAEARVIDLRGRAFTIYKPKVHRSKMKYLRGGNRAPT